MKRTKETRVLLAALAASLALHLILSPILRNIHPVDAATRVRPTPINILYVHLPPAKPSPQPALRPVAHRQIFRPYVAVQHRVRPPLARPVSNDIALGNSVNPGVSPGAAVGRAPSGPDGPGVPGPGIPAGAETAIPQPSCSAPDLQARAAETAALETPAEARAQGATGTVEVEVSLAADGTVTGTRIYRSSGWAALDQAGLRAARESTYRPEERNCRPVAGSYLFTAQFE